MEALYRKVDKYVWRVELSYCARDDDGDFQQCSRHWDYDTKEAAEANYEAMEKEARYIRYRSDTVDTNLGYPFKYHDVHYDKVSKDEILKMLEEQE